MGRLALVMSLVLVLVPVTAGPAVAANNNTVVAQGKAVYVDAGGNDRVIVGAHVKLCDRDDAFGVAYCHELATGRTGADGSFSIGAIDAGEDGTSELYVEISADSPGVRVAADLGTSPATYCFRTPELDTVHGGTAAFGTLRPLEQHSCAFATPHTDPRENGAFFVHTYVHRSWQYLNGINASIGLPPVNKVTVAVTAEQDTSHYNPVPFFETIVLNEGAWQDDAWGQHVVLHEYGHHVLYQLAESPAPDYDNGNCDSSDEVFFFDIIDAGHCKWLPEQGVVAWTEGFPSFLAGVIDNELFGRGLARGRTTWGYDGRRFLSEELEMPPIELVEDPGSAKVLASYEDGLFAIEGHPSSAYSHIEGFTSALLWDLYDARDDDHDQDGRRDTLQLSFRDIWEVVTTYDPAPGDDSHDHPTSVAEFYDGVLALHGGQVSASQLAGPYLENHFEVPAAGAKADTIVWREYSTDGAPGAGSAWSEHTKYHRGDSFRVRAKVCSNGELDLDAGGEAGVVLHWEQSGAKYHTFAPQALPALPTGACTEVTHDFTIPDDLKLHGPRFGDGRHSQFDVRFCADPRQLVAEANESDNCLHVAELRLENRAPVVTTTVTDGFDRPFPTDASGRILVPEGSSMNLSMDAVDPDPLPDSGLSLFWTTPVASGPSLFTRVDDPAFLLTPETTSQLADGDGTVYDVYANAQETPADDWAAWGRDVPKIKVLNVAPVPSINWSYFHTIAIFEGSDAVIAGTISDPGDDTFTGEAIFWGEAAEDVVVLDLDIDQDLRTFSVARSYDDETSGKGDDFTVCVRDDDDGETCQEGIVQVFNIAPVLDDVADVTADEGSEVALSVGFTDPGNDVWTATVDWGDGPVTAEVDVDTKTVSAVHVFAQDGSYPVQMCIDDGDGGDDCMWFTVEVSNVAPTVTLTVSPDGAVPLVAAEAAASFTDPGVDDTWTATVDWGDGSTIETVTVTGPTSDAPGTVQGAHVYESTGEYVLVVCVADGDDQTCVTETIGILSVEEKVAATIDEFRWSDDPAVVAAVSELDGPSHGQSGALQRLETGDLEAAVRKLAKAVDYLMAATTDQSDAMSVLSLVGESVARDVAQQVDALELTSKGDVKQVARMWSYIDVGRVHHEAGRYLDALHAYADAVRRGGELLG